MTTTNFDKAFNLKNRVVIENITKIFATCKGTLTRDSVGNKAGDVVTFYASEDRGMSHSGMPCWSEFSPKLFSSVEDAVSFAKNCGGVWNATIDSTTIEVVEVIAEVETVVNFYNRRATKV